MPASAKPSERVMRVIALAKAGVAPIDICRELKGAVKLGRIHHIISSARAADPSIPRFRAGLNPHLEIDVYGIAAANLRAAAQARKVTPNKLASRIVEAVARDQLFAAVLDDDGGAS